MHLNLAYRCCCRLDLDGAVPDHSSFSKDRYDRFRDSDLLRKLFELTVERCIAEGLVGAEGFAVDASLIRTDVHRQRSVPGEEGLPSEAAALVAGWLTERGKQWQIGFLPLLVIDCASVEGRPAYSRLTPGWSALEVSG